MKTIYVIVVPTGDYSKLRSTNGYTRREDAELRLTLDRYAGVDETRIREIIIDDPMMLDGMWTRKKQLRIQEGQ